MCTVHTGHLRVLINFGRPKKAHMLHCLIETEGPQVKVLTDFASCDSVNLSLGLQYDFKTSLVGIGYFC